MTAPIEVSSAGQVRAAAGPGARGRIKGARWVLAGAALLVTLIVLGYLTRTDHDSIPMSIKNPHPGGAMALAEVATDHGLTIRQIDSLVDARITKPDSTTLVVTSGVFLQGFQAQSILAYPGPIVVVGDASAVVYAATDTARLSEGSGGTVAAACSHPAARAAGTIQWDGPVFVDVPADMTTCFESGGGAVMMVRHRPGLGDVVFVADGTMVTNEAIAEHGNAALALQLIGRTTHAVWYVGTYYDTTVLTWTDPNNAGGSGDRAEIQPSTDFLPPGTGNALYALALALVFIVWWRARRFGPLVHEALPVVIRSAESTRGRARLYRAARAQGRAAASLRAAAALRMGQRLGVSRSSDRPALVAAVVRASGWPRETVESVLFGPPPTSESDMMTLLSTIDTLETEVHAS